MPRTDSTTSPCRMPAFAPGESATTCQAVTPWEESIQVTPSSGSMKLERYWKFSTANTTAANVRRPKLPPPAAFASYRSCKYTNILRTTYVSTSASSESQIPICVNPLLYYCYRDAVSPKRSVSHLWKMAYRLSYEVNYLKLEAQAASEEPISRHQNHLPVTCGQRHVPLGQQVAAIGQNFSVSGDESGELLTNLNAQVGIEVINRLAVGILLRDCWPVDPFVARDDLGSGMRNLCRKSGGGADSVLCRQLISERSLDGTFIRRQHSAVGVNHGHVEIAGKLLLVNQPCAHRAQLASVIGEYVRKIIRQIVGAGNSAAPEDRGVARCIVKHRRGDAGFLAEIVFNGNFFVQIIFEDGMPAVEQQCRERIQLVQSRLQVPGDARGRSEERR